MRRLLLGCCCLVLLLLFPLGLLVWAPLVCLVLFLSVVLCLSLSGQPVWLAWDWAAGWGSG